MSLYGQEPEVTLLASFLSSLDHRSVIDVGAERGAFAEQMLLAGSEVVHVIEPEPDNAAFLRQRFANEPRVTIHQYAVSDGDGQLELRTSVTPDGAPVTFGHTVLDLPDTDAIAWRRTTQVRARSLASLVDTDELPARVGILKVDTEGHDLAVVAGMGRLQPDVVMVEHWADLPLTLGPCPWTAEEMCSELRKRGFSHFAFIVHLGDFVILQWDDGDIPHGYMGNLVFLHARVLETLLPAILEISSSLARGAVEVGEAYARSATDRQAVISEVSRSRLGRRLLRRVGADQP